MPATISLCQLLDRQQLVSHLKQHLMQVTFLQSWATLERIPTPIKSNMSQGFLQGIYVTWHCLLQINKILIYQLDVCLYTPADNIIHTHMICLLCLHLHSTLSLGSHSNLDLDKRSSGIHFFKVLVQIHYSARMIFSPTFRRKILRQLPSCYRPPTLREI